MVSISEIWEDKEGFEQWFENPQLHLRLRDFRKPPPLAEEDLVLLTELGTGPKTYDTGLVIGRFQPLHYGHIFLMMQALRVCDQIAVGIGSANVVDEKNPFPIDLREQMLREALHDFGLTARLTQIVRINDVNDDQQWFEQTRLLTKFDVVVGNNESGVNRIFRERGIPTVQTPLLNRAFYQGTHIRWTLSNEGLLPQII